MAAVEHNFRPAAPREVTRCWECDSRVEAIVEGHWPSRWVMPVDRKGRCTSCALTAPLEEEDECTKHC